MQATQNARPPRPREAMPSNGKIIRFWARVAEFHARRSEKAGKLPLREIPPFLYHVLLDRGEAVCMACGKFFGDCQMVPPDRKGRPRPWWAIWDRSRLIRCHIMPHSLGGTIKLKNLLLLCSWCHKEAPDNGDPQYMIRWVNNREAFIRQETERLVREAIAANEKPGKPFDAWGMLKHIRDNNLWDEFEDFKLKFETFHWDGDNGSMLKVTTVVNSWWAFARERLGWDV